MGHVANIRIRLDTENTHPQMQAWESIAWTRALVQMEVSGDLEVTDQIQATIGRSKVAALSTSSGS
jgi:hypothetical protein